MTAPDPCDPPSFRALGKRVVDLLADHLDRARNRAIPVLCPQDPTALLEAWQTRFPTAPDPDGDRLIELLRAVLDHSNHLHHPGYVGHQVARTLPAASLVEMTHAILNNGMAVYEMGQLQSVLERRVIEFLAGTLGFGASADGVLTHGGSLGNFTALLAARQAKAGHDVWTEGQREPMAVLVADQAHYCVGRAVQCMGWGGQGAWPVPTDEAFRMDPAALPGALAAARSAGRRVIAVVASSCSTATGSFDPIPALADFCADHDLWLHVDGAHGASLALSSRHRHLLAGIERADSVVWDLHKMMSLPALNTAVLFREGRRSYEAFAQEAGYLFDTTRPEEQWFNLGQRTMECTKRAMGVTAFCMLQTLGTAWFGAQVDALIERTAWLEAEIAASGDFEIACPAAANILCFRHIPAGPGDQDLDALQERMRHRVIQDGSFYLVQARVRGTTWLRVTIMNPETTREDLSHLLVSLRNAARRS